jgi:hypothetical protein
MVRKKYFTKQSRSNIKLVIETHSGAFLMTTNLQNLRDDIDYMKVLAREGRHAPLVGGSILALAGGVWGTASLVMYGLIKGVIPGGQTTANITWGIAMVVFIGGLILSKSKLRATPGASAVNNRANSAVWAGCGFGIFALCCAIGVVSWRLHTAVPMWLISPAILVTYGIAWTVASAMSEVKWLKLMGPASFVGAIILALMSGLPEMFLANAAALLMLAGLPGLILLRNQPSEVV